MKASEFVAKWRPVELTERSSAQSHFIDLCRLVDHKTPIELDPYGDWFTFERGLKKQTGGHGWADVWKRDHFAFEYKGRHKNLDAAFAQLLLYKTPLEEPPLLVTCDIGRIVIYTNFRSKVEIKHEIDLEDLVIPSQLDKLAWVFHEPKKFDPRITREAITNEVAGRFGRIAQGMRARGLQPRAVAKYLNRLVFCMFAVDAGLLHRDLFKKSSFSPK